MVFGWFCILLFLWLVVFCNKLAKNVKEKIKMSRFDYVKYDEKSCDFQAGFKDLFETVEFEVDKLAPGRAKALIYTKLEEAYMWVGKAIRDEQIYRQTIKELQEERKDG